MFRRSLAWITASAHSDPPRSSGGPFATSDRGPLGAGVEVRTSVQADAGFTPDADAASFIGSEALAPNRGRTGESVDETLAAFRTDLELLLGTGSLSEQWSVVVVSVEQGDTIFALNADAPMAPASNMKLFTSAAALHLLGPNFRFPTYLLADGPVVDGVLEGNLVLYGTGDPTLGGQAPARPTGAYQSFLEALRKAGIQQVRGEVIGDGSYYSGNPRRPSWNPADLDNWYAAPVSALTFNENMVTLRVAPTREAGLPTQVYTIPEGAGVPIRNESRVHRRGIGGGHGPGSSGRPDPGGRARCVPARWRHGARSRWRTRPATRPRCFGPPSRPGGSGSTGRRRPVARNGARSGGARGGHPSSPIGSSWRRPSRLRGGCGRSRSITRTPSPADSPGEQAESQPLRRDPPPGHGARDGRDRTSMGGARALHRFLVEEVGADESARFTWRTDPGSRA
jgi:hypothetical protein